MCTGPHIGYNPAEVMANITQTNVSVIAEGTSTSLTHVTVLHPIECGLAFISFLLAFGSGMAGSFAGAMVAFLAWVLTLISLAIDFSLFSLVRHHVNEDGSGSEAYFGTGIWCLVGAFVTLLFGQIIVFFTCFNARRAEKKKTQAPAVVEKTAAPQGKSKR